MPKPMTWQKIPILTLVCALLLPACAAAGSPPPATAHYQGTIVRSCSPVDALATELHLQRQSGRGPAAIIVAIWSPAAIRAGSSLALAGQGDQGALSLCTASGDCRLAAAAVVQFDSDPAGPLTGRIWLPDVPLRASFRAEAGPDEPVLCG